MRPVGALLLLATLGGCTVAGPVTDPTPSFYQRIDQGAVLDPVAASGMVNAWRVRNGLSSLTQDPVLAEEARRRAASMAETDTAGWGEMPVLAAQRGAAGGLRLERVSAGYRTLAEAFSGWRDSPPHNAVMLAPGGRRIGIGAMYRPGTKYQVYWTIIVTD